MALLTAGVIAALAAAPAPAVLGGRNATQPYPFMAALRDGGSQICGASLIAPKVALTAAHCVDDGNPNGLSVRLGSTKRTGSDGEIIAIEAIEVHEDYDGDPGGGSDIALLRLEAASVQQPIHLGTAAETALWDAGKIGRVIGWGSAVFLVGPGNNDLQELDLPVVSDRDCKSVYSEYNSATMICAGEDSGLKDSCQGDSGGPLFAFNAAGAAVQFGTVSYGLGCGFPGYYGVYGRVGASALRDWIAARVPSINQSVATPAPAGAPAATSTPASGSGSGSGSGQGGSAPGGSQPAGSNGSGSPAPAGSTNAPVTRIRFVRNVGSARQARKRKRIRVRVHTTGVVRGLRATVKPRRKGRALSKAKRSKLRRGTTTLTLKLSRKMRRKVRAGSLRLTLSGRDSAGKRVVTRGVIALRR